MFMAAVFCRAPPSVVIASWIETVVLPVFCDNGLRWDDFPDLGGLPVGHL